MNKASKARVRETVACKTISIPRDLLAWAQAKIKADPDLDFSKYVKRLIRADIATPPHKK